MNKTITKMSQKATTYVTANLNKYEESMKILGTKFPLKLTSKNIELPEYQGEPTYIAKEKCKHAAEYIKGPVIVEDTSLCFNAYKGLPGPYIRSFFSKLGNTGLYDMLQAKTDKSAYALCIVAYSSGPGENVILFEGRRDGTIVSPRGIGSFGWDNIFKPDGYDQTYAEMNKDTKNKISHRCLALTKMYDHFMSHVHSSGDQ